MPFSPPPSKLLTTRQVADLLGLAPKTLRNWRTQGLGPVAHKLGNRVRYRAEDVVDWLGDCRESS